MTITEFLLARISEDESAARAAAEGEGVTGHWTPAIIEDATGAARYECILDGAGAVDEWSVVSHDVQQTIEQFEVHSRAPQFEHIARHDPARVLAECAAKRRILELADEATGLDMIVDGDRRVGPRDDGAEPYVGDVMLRALASVYAEHQDFRDEWRL